MFYFVLQNLYLSYPFLFNHFYVPLIIKNLKKIKEISLKIILVF